MHILIEKLLDNTIWFAVIVIFLQSILLPKIKATFPIYIIPLLVFIGGEYMVWSSGEAKNQILGTFVVIGLTLLLLITGLVAKHEIRRSNQEKLSKNEFYTRK